VANVLGEFSNTGRIHPLTEKGIEQAQALARELAGLHAERVYASPLQPAHETAEILAEALGAPLTLTEALCEWSVGIYEGTSGPEGWELHRQVRQDWLEGRLESKMPQGESYLEIRKRFAPFIEGLLREGQGVRRTILLVAHGGLYLAMLPEILANVSPAFAVRQGFPTTSYAVAESRPDGLYCLSWGGVSPAGG
jgi:probable phosphoglycerate mutase